MERVMKNKKDTFELFHNKKIVITGGLGFIGSNLAKKLVELGAKVTLIDSLISEYGGSLFNIQGIEDKVRVNISDVRDNHSMQYLIRGQDYLFNLAGQTSHIDSMKNPQTDLEINCTSQLSILEACRNQNPDIKVIFASTRQIYGKPDYLPVDENHPLRPVDVNGINKMSGERYHILYNNVYKIRTCALRLTNTYGPRMRIKDARQTFVGIWIKLILQNRPFEVWDGGQLRDFTYIDDCVDALLLAACNDETNGQVFNLGGASVVSLKDLADLLVEVNGGGSYSVHEFPAERKKIDIGDYYSDFSKFENTVGWRPQIDLKEGLTRTLEFFKNNITEYI
jgi:UDP-glucose 4-epimerase